MIVAFLQMNAGNVKEHIKIMGACVDIKAGERIQAHHIKEVNLDPEIRIEDYSPREGDFLNKVCLVNIPKGALLCQSYFKDDDKGCEVEKGKALTAIKFFPDSAICWISEIGSILDVYFVDSEGTLEKLGQVRLVQVYDQKMGSEEMLFFAVVEGTEKVVSKIVQKRGLGRIEVVKTQ